MRRNSSDGLSVTRTDLAGVEAHPNTRVECAVRRSERPGDGDGSHNYLTLSERFGDVIDFYYRPVEKLSQPTLHPNPNTVDQMYNKIFPLE